ncbi:hypothetical protein BZY99_17240 [Pectobacterium versatile]|nr:hypothetical protein BV916_17055 [Pectobacterium odoriferum]PRI18406.1 hypothetical protein BZY99_17240 [Pectobacterium versatile]
MRLPPSCDSNYLGHIPVIFEPRAHCTQIIQEIFTTDVPCGGVGISLFFLRHPAENNATGIICGKKRRENKGSGCFSRLIKSSD